MIYFPPNKVGQLILFQEKQPLMVHASPAQKSGIIPESNFFSLFLTVCKRKKCKMHKHDDDDVVFFELQ